MGETGAGPCCHGNHPPLFLPGVSATSSTSGLPDMTGSVYNKTQTFGEQGFHAETLPSFSLPSALGSTGPLAPRVAPSYTPPPFLHILPAHQQPHSLLAVATAFCRVLRAALVSTNSPPAPCSPNHKPSNPPGATLLTGQTKP